MVLFCHISPYKGEREEHASSYRMPTCSLVSQLNQRHFINSFIFWFLDCSVRIQGGNHCCYFPFILNGELQTSCLTTRRPRGDTARHRAWCSMTYDFDKKPIWKYCQGTCVVYILLTLKLVCMAELFLSFFERKTIHWHKCFS